MKDKLSIYGNSTTKSLIEKTAASIFCGCSIVSIIAVVSITGYMIYAGVPAIFSEGLTEILFSTVWSPSSTDPSFGILYVILTSIIGVGLAVLIGVPIGILTAVNLTEIVHPKIKGVLKGAIELLAGIPSVIYGLLGVIIINPIMYQIELYIFKDSTTHQFTGGANLISAVIVLAIMILPTLINITQTSLEAVSDNLRTSSSALGASKMQTIFKVVLPSAKTGIMTAVVLGVGRAIGEAMAIVMVAGNSVNIPLPFNSVRFLTTAIVSEMGYASGTHRQVLFTIGLVLFVFIIIINLVLTRIIKKGDHHGN